MASYSWDLQTAIYAALVGASIPGVSKIVDAKIADPKKADFPFIEIGEMQTIQDDVTCADGTQDVTDIHVWSRYRGQKQVKQTMGAVHDALHNTTLTVSGLSSCHAFVESERVITDPDGLTRHGVVTIRTYSRKGA
jgi:hypothetical protein